MIFVHPEHLSLGQPHTDHFITAPRPQKREGKTPYFKVKGPQTAQRIWAGSLVSATNSSFHYHLPQTLPALAHREPPNKPSSKSDTPQYPPGASSSAWRMPGPCCGRSRSSGHTRQRAWEQSRDTARYCQPTWMTVHEQGKTALPTACTGTGHNQSLLSERQQGMGPRTPTYLLLSALCQGQSGNRAAGTPVPAQSISPSSLTD